MTWNELPSWPWPSLSSFVSPEQQHLAVPGQIDVSHIAKNEKQIINEVIQITV